MLNCFCFTRTSCITHFGSAFPFPASDGTVLLQSLLAYNLGREQLLPHRQMMDLQNVPSGVQNLCGGGFIRLDDNCQRDVTPSSFLLNRAESLVAYYFHLIKTASLNQSRPLDKSSQYDKKRIGKGGSHFQSVPASSDDGPRCVRHRGVNLQPTAQFGHL